MQALWMVLIATGCGRIAFDPLGDSGSIDGGDDANGGTFCDSVTPVPTFCADFDEGLPLEAGFTDSMTMSGGAIAAAPIARSGAGAFASSFSAQTPAMAAWGTLIYASQGTVSSVAVAYDVYYTARPPNGHMECNNITVRVAGDGVYYNDLDMDAGGTDHYLQEYDSDTDVFMGRNHDIPAITAGSWHHVTWDMDLAARTVSISMDGVVLDSGTTVYPISAGTVQFDAGINYAIDSTMAGNTIYVDNVVINFD